MKYNLQKELTITKIHLEKDGSAICGAKGKIAIGHAHDSLLCKKCIKIRDKEKK